MRGGRKMGIARYPAVSPTPGLSLALPAPPGRLPERAYRYAYRHRRAAHRHAHGDRHPWPADGHRDGHANTTHRAHSIAYPFPLNPYAHCARRTAEGSGTIADGNARPVRRGSRRLAGRGAVLRPEGHGRRSDRSDREVPHR